MDVACLLFLLFSSVVGQRYITSPRQVTVDAAFRYDGDVFLISGDEYMCINSEGFEVYVKVRVGDAEVPITADLQAAVRWPSKPLVHFYDSHFSYKNNQTDRTSSAHRYGRFRQFLHDGGPDAAAFKSGRFYIFKGCEFVSQGATLWKLGTPQPISTLGFPCDIDAAWTDEDLRGMTVLKGDKIWRWREHNPVEGPIPFTDLYHIWTWNLISTGNDTTFHL